ncbi:hypothetical protein ACRRTK_001476 [Alexandromys fortis]
MWVRAQTGHCETAVSEEGQVQPSCSQIAMRKSTRRCPESSFRPQCVTHKSVSGGKACFAFY